MIYVFLMIILFLGIQNDSRSLKLDKLKIRIDNFEERIIKETIDTILFEPQYLFRFVEVSSEWEEVNAVPYSKCYRHLISTTTPIVSDYIICKAI